MGRLGYPPELKLRARVLWLQGSLTDAQIAAELGVTRIDTIGMWRRQEHWEREKQLIQQESDRRVQNAVAETIADMNARHLKEYQLLQTKGLAALKRLDPQRATEAQQMVDAGIKGERLVRGEPTEIHEMRSLMRANVQVLEFVVADVLKVLLEAGQIDGNAARQFAELFAERVNQADFQYVTEPE
jgi:hypothetical protein